MSVPFGKAALQRLTSYVPTGWYVTALKTLVTEIIAAHMYRSEIRDGGVVTAVVPTASVMQITTTALKSMLRGRIMADIAAQTAQDPFTTGGVFGQAIYTDGSTAAGILLSGTQVARVTLIVCNTDGAGGVSGADNGTPKIVAIVHGTSSTYAAQTGHATSAQIQAALEASTGVHAGVTAWAHLSQHLWANAGGSPTLSVTMNRNNAVSAA